MFSKNQLNPIIQISILYRRKIKWKRNLKKYKKLPEDTVSRLTIINNPQLRIL